MPSSRDRSDTVKAMRPFLPAKDFELSKRFYADLRFRAEPLGNELAEMNLSPHSFLLQNYFVEDWAGNFVMHMLVEDLDGWWAQIASLDLASRYGVESPRPPKLEPWGLRVAHVFDPSGVLWQFAEPSRQDDGKVGSTAQSARGGGGSPPCAMSKPSQSSSGKCWLTTGWDS